MFLALTKCDASQLRAGRKLVLAMGDDGAEMNTGIFRAALFSDKQSNDQIESKLQSKLQAKATDYDTAQR